MANHATIRAALEDLLEQYEGHIRALLDDLHGMMQEIADRGEARMIEILESAVTITGLKRAARGGHPGRVETGDMVDAISSDVEHKGDEIIAEWGWLDEVHEYFLLQEWGDGVWHVKFEGMKALLGSYIEMREELRARLGTS